MDTNEAGMTGGKPDVETGPYERAPVTALVSWVFFDWAAQPYYTLILTFLFAPYFATVVVGDAVTGQALWGYAAAIAGAAIAIGSPLLGALADRQGKRKSWIALFAVSLVISLALLGFAEPNASLGRIILVLAAFAVATVMAEFATVFVNAMMPGLVPAHELGRLSGVGWAAGYAGGLVSLAIMAGLVVTDPRTGLTVLGLEPLITDGYASHIGDRLTGPFSAIWFSVFVIPFFLFVPETKHGTKFAAPRAPRPLAELWDTIRSLPSLPDMLFFLAARMLYIDGLSAIFVFGGIYGAAVFGWGALELGLFGIILTLTGVAGALIGGVVNDRAGSKRVILTALVLLIVAALGILSVDKSHVFYVADVAPKAPGSVAFSSTGEIVFIAFAVLVGLVAAPIQSASRVLLAQLAPAGKLTQFFGLFAFSGKVTAFFAPLVVATATAVSGSQRIGMASILLFLIAGLAVLTYVDPQRGMANR